MRIRANSLILALALGLAALPAQAIPIQYFYQGPTLPVVAGLPAGITSISGSFTVDLPASTTSLTANFPLLAFSFTDGVSTADPADFIVNFAHFRTDAAAAVIDFAIELFRPSRITDTGTVHQLIVVRHDLTPFNFFGNASATFYCTSIFPSTISTRCASGLETSSFAPGSLTTVPEPATLSLLGLGLLGLGLSRRRRKAATV